MSWIARILYFIFVVVLARSIFSLLSPRRGSGASQSPPGRGNRGSRSGKTVVRDPHCGMYIDPSLAIAQKKQGEVLYFCSETCRDRFLELAAGTEVGESPTH